MLLEDAFTIKGKTYLRTYDENTQKSNKTLTNYKSEYYLPDPNGEYRGFLDNKPLKKMQGSAWEVEDAYGVKQAKYVALREELQKYNYNKDPRTWFLDIETFVDSSFPNAETADQEISTIQFLDSKTNKIYLLSQIDFVYKDDYTSPEKLQYNFEFYKFDSEIELLQKFFMFFREQNPFIIYAWNGDYFDFPYIYNRAKIYRFENRLSNYGPVELKTRKLDNGQIINTLLTAGHYFLDMLDIYKKFVYKNVPNYRLDTIAEIEINQNKVDYSNYNTFKDFYLGNYKITGNETEEQKKSKIYKLRKALDENKIPKENIQSALDYIKQKSQSEFLYYALIDTVVLKGIHDNNQFTTLMMSIAETMGVSLRDTMGTLMPWEHYIGNTIYKVKKVLPPKQENHRGTLIGGFVKDPIVGKHDWVFSLDYTSLYPNIIRAYNMSPETFREISYFSDPEFSKIYNQLNHQDEDKALKLLKDPEFSKKLQFFEKKYNIVVCFGGGIFDKSKQGFIPELVGNIFNQRKTHKKKMLEYKSEITKIDEILSKRGVK